jgi:hypothetical protein
MKRLMGLNCNDQCAYDDEDYDDCYEDDVDDGGNDHDGLEGKYDETSLPYCKLY